MVQRERWWHGGIHELSFAVEMATLRWEEYRGAKADAELWKARFDPRRWLTGTIDYWRKGWIDDLKTGAWEPDITTRQLLSYSIYDWLALGKPGDWDCARSITWWPRYPLGKPPRRAFGRTITLLDLTEHIDDIRWALQHPGEVNPEPVHEGKYDPNAKLGVCAFCDCRPTFPGASWMGYRYRALPHCHEGALKLIKEQHG